MKLASSAVLWTLLALALALGCGSDTKESPPPHTAVPATQALAKDAGDARPEAQSASDARAASSCVSECVRSRQMQATSPEQITRDCEARCQREEAP